MISSTEEGASALREEAPVGPVEDMVEGVVVCWTNEGRDREDERRRGRGGMKGGVVDGEPQGSLWRFPGKVGKGEGSGRKGEEGRSLKSDRKTRRNEQERTLASSPTRGLERVAL